MRAGIYARYSTNRQSAQSIDDQVRLCREHAERLDAEVVSVYTDYAISGAVMNRPGLQALMADARAGRFELVISEALDRLSRDQEDVAAIFKRLSFADVRIVTFSEGEINELHVGLKGTMNALFLKDLAHKIRRGQRGRIEAGRSAGSLAYGYDVVRELGSDGEQLRGKRRINEKQAATIQRIYEAYVAGRSPRAIAAELNHEGVLAPRGGHWNASTINGSRSRRDGILWNELYIGKLIYNRQRFVKDPETGNRVPKLNPPEDWVVVEVPELRIVDQDVWDRVRAIKSRSTVERLHNRRRPKRLLSGILYCGVCGGHYTVIGEERFGCATRREKGICTNSKTISVRKLEERVLAGLKDRLLAPEYFAEFVREYRLELTRRKRHAERTRNTLEAALRDAESRIGRIVTAIEEGADAVPLRDRLAELDERRAGLVAELEPNDGQPDVLEIHPNMAEIYRRKVAELRDALNADPGTRQEAIVILRSLIDRIVLHPGKKRGELTIELRGQLASILSLAHQAKFGAEAMTMLVAEEGLEPPTRGL